MCSKPSCLGEPWCSDWSCCDTGPSAPKRRRVDSAVEDERPEAESRLALPHSPTSLAKICEGYVPSNTTKSTSWALRVFRSWRKQRNKRVAERCPENLLEQPVVDRLNYCLSRFVVDVRREDGKSYLPASINNILAGLYRYSKSSVPTGVVCPNFMNRKDPSLCDLTGAIQVR